MNWLITQVGLRRRGIGGFDDVALGQPGTNLRLVPYQQLLPFLPAQMAVSDRRDRPLVEAGFALLEDAAEAQVRYELAEPSLGPLPDLYTVAIDQGSSSVLYLPQDADSEQDTLQLFTFKRLGGGRGVGEGSRLVRLRALGAFTDEYGLIEAIEMVEPVACADGPCGVWGEGCGEGCRCHRFELPTPPGRGRVYGLICK